MGVLITGLALNLLAVFGVLSKINDGDLGHGSVASVFSVIVIGSWVLGVAGAILIKLHPGQRKLGGILAIVGSVIFVPLGLVAIMGAKRAMTPSDDEQLATRRAAARKQAVDDPRNDPPRTA